MIGWPVWAAMLLGVALVGASCAPGDQSSRSVGDPVRLLPTVIQRELRIPVDGVDSLYRTEDLAMYLIESGDHECFLRFVRDEVSTTPLEQLGETEDDGYFAAMSCGSPEFLDERGITTVDQGGLFTNVSVLLPAGFAGKDGIDVTANVDHDVVHADSTLVIMSLPASDVRPDTPSRELVIEVSCPDCEPYMEALDVQGV